MPRERRNSRPPKKGGPFTDVDQSYLDDAVFIGDSRTDTLKMYAGWENTTYYVKTGTNIWDIMDVVPDDENTPFVGDIQNQQIQQFFIMLGVNELGNRYSGNLLPAVQKRLWQAYQELQPNALIFLVYYSCIRREAMQRVQ